MGIRWIRNILVENEKTTLEIQIGDQKIGDKCYTRINSEVEKWFDNLFDDRQDIIAQGIDILKKRLEGKIVSYPDGRSYDWQ